MPELPEVEAARRGIAEQLVGKTLVGYTLYRPSLLHAPDGLSLDQLVGQRLVAVNRWGKHLWLTFEQLGLLLHLKLTGQLVARGAAIPGFAAGHPVPAYDAPLPHKSTALQLDFCPDAHLYLTDVRSFARAWLWPPEAIAAMVQELRLGPDLLSPDFTREAFIQRLTRRREGQLKPVLLDQRVVAGLGNIYVDESLWQAQLHPARRVGTLTLPEIDRLYEAIKTVMEVAVPIGGARILHGKALPPPGEFPFVHGRAGQPCLRCGTTILKIVVGQRGTYLCPHCQPAPSGQPVTMADDTKAETGEALSDDADAMAE